LQGLQRGSVLYDLGITTLIVLFAVVPLAPELKFVVIGAVGVPACFAVGYWTTRVPGVSKVL
jgi:hypothetical protein